MISNPFTYLKIKAGEAGWIPIVADNRSTDYELMQVDTTEGSLVCVLQRSGSVQLPKEGQSFNGDVIHPITMVIYRKTESDTLSSIAETYAQKRDNRLDEIMSDVVKFLFSINCSNEFDVSVNSINEVINVRDASMDGVQVELSLRAWNQW